MDGSVGVGGPSYERTVKTRKTRQKREDRPVTR
jgi:hypothetical protein